jgi:mediator of RNA polymerase II transcription subunit 12
VNLLCEWAVSTQRTGEHRAVIVAKLLEKRQNEIGSEVGQVSFSKTPILCFLFEQKFSDLDLGDERDSVASEMIGGGGSTPFQMLLMNFLDKKAPLLDDNPTMENRSAFANLILLFCELIANDVFSHDAYICTLISRGDLMQYPAMQPAAVVSFHHDNVDLSSIKSESMKQEVLVF